MGEEHLRTRTLTELPGKFLGLTSAPAHDRPSCSSAWVAYNFNSMNQVIPTRSRWLGQLPVAAIIMAGTLLTEAPATSQTMAPVSRFRAAAETLSQSTIVDPMIEARAAAHIAAMAEDPARVRAGLRACPDARSRLAYLDAFFAGGSRAFDASAFQSEAISMLAATTPDDRAARIEREMLRIESEGEMATVNWGSLNPADLIWRPFVWSPETAADRLARSSDAIRRSLLSIAIGEKRPRIMASVLASLAGEPTDFEAAVLACELDGLIRGPAVIQELVQRRATDALVRLTAIRPEVLALPGVRISAAACIARDRPDDAIRLLGGENNLSRLPSNAQSSVRKGLAEGLRRDPDPERWRSEIMQAGQADDRLEALLGLEAMHRDATTNEMADPDRTFEEIDSFRTLGEGRVVSAMENGLIDRDDAIAALGDLFRTGRYELAYTFLQPNTTEPTRAADQWLPTRIGLMGEALANADASPDAWIPLIDSMSRLDRLDGQVAALRAIQASYQRIHGDEDLPQDVRLTLDNALLEIALD